LRCDPIVESEELVMLPRAFVVRAFLLLSTVSCAEAPEAPTRTDTEEQAVEPSSTMDSEMDYEVDEADAVVFHSSADRLLTRLLGSSG
jgi:hypothetical protein